MTKKEQAAFDELHDQVNKLQYTLADQVLIAKALNWTKPIAPDVAPPKSSGLTKGFLFNVAVARVAPACSGPVSHNYGADTHTSTQGTRWLYSTKLLALQALRHEVEKECAARLAAIDKQIEQEQAAT